MEANKDALCCAEICCYNALSGEMVKGCRSEGEELCVHFKCCCASGDPKINESFGVIKEDGERRFPIFHCYSNMHACSDTNGVAASIMCCGFSSLTAHPN